MQKFVFINYSNCPTLARFHGKVIALDINDPHAPFSSIFILHEMRVRGFHPLEPNNPEVGDGRWQDWIYSDGVIDDSSGSLKRKPDNPPNDEPDEDSHTQSLPQSNLMTVNQSDASPGGRRVVLNEGVIADILAATHGSPSWKACQMEGTSWAGTAEENIQIYKDLELGP